MREKFREFFAKHQHLIVIALVFAIILAALTPLLVPLGLKLEEKINLPEIDLPSPIVRFRKLNAKKIQYYTVSCDKIPSSAENDALLDTVPRKSPEEIAALCTILNEAPLKQDQGDSDHESLLSISLHGTLVIYHYSLVCADGRYSLTGTGRFGGWASWYISEESARALMAYCYCTKDSLHSNPRKDLCDADQITAASLLTWENQVYTEPKELTREQIETLCAFLEDALLPERYSRKKYSNSPPSGSNGWQATLSMQDGLTWQVQYNSWQRCLSLCCEDSVSTNPKAVGYTCKDKSVLAALPELILDAEK